ncbi:FAD-dependent oxidoreductase [Geminicoccaceae bacterium 1502E]|nr:FAD-dependent oxidoreductase [Geminicoccaceae bacterium 1502E]
MTETVEPDLCVVGAGSGGLAVAAGAVQMGASVVLVEAGKMGGDCLNYGCVPSKSLIAAGRAAQGLRTAGRFGIEACEPQVDFAAVNDHVRGVIAAIAPHDSVERFEGLGVRVLRARARFTGPEEVEADGVRVRARRFVLATGSRAAIPPVPGLDAVPFLTNETIFELRRRPEHLLVLGGGPIGCELAQAHRRLGSKVTMLDLGPILPRDDPELSAVVRARLLDEGVELVERVEVLRAEPGPALVIRQDGLERRLEGSDLLVAAGRRPNVEEMGLEAAGIAHGKGGIEVDGRLRTTNRRVFAMGDVAGGLQFTHLAGWHAGIVIQNALFGLPAKARTSAMPRVTYTDPELASVGLSEAAAQEQGRSVKILRWTFSHNDRAQAERETEGLIKVVASRRGRILGAGIAGPHAGELILPWVMAVGQGMRLKAMASVIAPYPTLSEVSKRAAGSFFAPTLYGPWTRRLVRLLAKLG